MINEIKEKLPKSMSKAIENFKHQLTKIRTSRASANVLEGITVSYYGNPTPLNQVGQISTPEARLLQIQPFDKTIIGDVEKAIMAANIGLTPSNDGNLIRIPFPSLTEERRKEQVKELKKMGEEAKVIIRNLRRDENDHVKKAEKNKEIAEDDSKKFQTEIQHITDKYIAEVDQIIKLKEKEVLEV